MDGIVWAALITALGALAVAIFGWYVNRSHGLPSGVATAIRSELHEQIDLQLEKIERLEADKTQCERQISSLGDALVERDIIIAALHRKLGLDPPKLKDPRPT